MPRKFPPKLLVPEPAKESADPTIFTREDWQDFRTLQGLARKAGVSPERLLPVALKELADNALDASGNCRRGRLDNGGLFIEDDGKGLPGTDDEIAYMFSIRRPLMTSKLIRLPTRGALGNGLRVVAGLVLVSEGYLRVCSRGRILHLTPNFDGTTSVERVGTWDRPGTRIEIYLGSPVG